MEQAQAILEEQRKAHPENKNAEVDFWLTVRDNPDQITTIQLTKGTKDKLDKIKVGRESYEQVVLRLIKNYERALAVAGFKLKDDEEQ